MRTPTVMIIGMVFAPCGLVLNLTSTVAPNWRQISGLNNNPSDTSYHQGLWDICIQILGSSSSSNFNCGQSNTAYFSLQEVQVARGLMIASLVGTALGIALASLGVRCWRDIPIYLVAGLGGLVIFISGILSLIAVSWYNNDMYTMGGITNLASTSTIQVDYALVLGYLGSCMEIIGGFSLSLSLVHNCKKCMEKRGKSPAAIHYRKKNKYAQNPIKTTYPGSTVYSVRADSPARDHGATNLGYSIGNDNYRYGDGGRRANSVVTNPRSYTNSMDVREGERPRSYGRPESQLSSLPCDSDLL
ncbi:claudin-23 [Pelobates fuscus]|uniref:claudin-23 n=1 Tax=Pelobates fuscus TaxID=191477 RepID=UPI002FE440D2